MAAIERIATGNRSVVKALTYRSIIICLDFGASFRRAPRFETAKTKATTNATPPVQPRVP